ncbi:MAG: CBS domain-containing protein, partial [Candidatus Cloacimonetes bacterium]|nr:CBS domain-containing protein [Candidatus Cloacimonadota bacterium]
YYYEKLIEIKNNLTKYENIVITTEDDNIQYAMGIMNEKRIKHLPIMKNSKTTSVISIGDIVKAQLEHSEHVAKTYLDHIKGKTPQPNDQEY